MKKESVDEEIGNIGKWGKYAANKLSKTDLKLCEPGMVENSMFKWLRFILADILFALYFI